MQKEEVETFADFCEFVGELREKFPSWRAGQAAFNGLHMVRRDLCDRIEELGLDPFHMQHDNPEHRKRIKAFWAWLRFHWNDKAGD